MAADDAPAAAEGGTANAGAGTSTSTDANAAAEWTADAQHDGCRDGLPAANAKHGEGEWDGQPPVMSRYDITWDLTLNLSCLLSRVGHVGILLADVH